MPPATVYLDECVSWEIGHLLSARGVHVHLPREEGTLHASDPAQLMTCMRSEWVLVTQNRRDFRRLHWLWTALYDWGLLPGPHAGILTIHEQVVARYPEWATAIVDLLQEQPRVSGRMYRWRPASRQWDAEPARLM
jgi:hypothetical protein